MRQVRDKWNCGMDLRDQKENWCMREGAKYCIKVVELRELQVGPCPE